MDGGIWPGVLQVYSFEYCAVCALQDVHVQKEMFRSAGNKATLESGRWPSWNDSVGMDLSTTSVSLQLKLKRALLVLDSCAKSHERYTVR